MCADLPHRPPPAGSKWPKTSLGSLRDGRRLTPEELALLCIICKEESAAACRQRPEQQQQQREQQHAQQQASGGSGSGASAAPGAAEGALARAAEATAAAAAGAGEAEDAPGIKLTVDSAAVVLFECRSLERLLSFQSVVFQGEGIHVSL